ncbi:PAF acetylhydrolase [Sphaerulina musiva SO2202]|uniref:Putative phospholipase n=1 Tax=Sphaerulina musiva (strain SO2202) TaxID=692275 RepID=N1QKF9_SPHMS|nr:PAF acetylhydrolase [Sphaerulina musiva SO2202]EMF16767.1 PAF acetylhydrolase [Sphaerulina musiva SO2202]
MDILQPRWLESRQSSHTHKTSDFFRPRLTAAYVCCSIVALYVLYCYIVRSPLFASKLPKYTGRFDVGAIDIEVPVVEPHNIVNSVFKQNGEPAFRLDTVLFTLYYPAVKGSRSSKPRHKWFPKPISLIAEGYAHAAHFNNFFSRPLFTFALWGLASSIDIPAKVDVPLIDPSSSMQDADGDEADLSRLPVVVLSHGDVSSRTDYTAYCGELASRGIVVAAIEHRDGSCPGSIVHLPHGKTRRVLLWRADQLKPENGKEEVSNDEWRFQKLAYRDAEIHETIRVLEDLDLGRGDEVFSYNYRKEGKDLEHWKGRLDFSHLVIAGHSFGATGALQALKSANSATGGIILDPGKSSGQLNTDIDVPLLVVHSDSWSKAHTIFYNRPHFDTVRDIASHVLNRTGASWFMTSLKTSHPSCTDAPLIEPLLLSWTTGATINVREGLREYVRVSMEFIEFLQTGKRSGVLDIGPTHESYGNDTRSLEQKNSIPHSIMRYWQVHVAPEVRFPEEEDGDSMRTKVDDRSMRYDEDGYSVQTRVNDGSIRYDEDDAYSMQTRVKDRFLRYDEEDADSVKTRGTR